MSLARATVGQLLDELAIHDRDTELVVQARRDLAMTGLGLKVPGEVMHHDAGHVLCVLNDHALLKRLFRNSEWSNGGWKDALRQCPITGVMTFDRATNRVAIGGVQERCTLVAMRRYNEALER